MAARSASPTHAFDPTPALEHDPDNYSSLSHSPPIDSSVDLRSVRFPDPPSMPIHPRHSIATSNVPLLQPVSSASQLPKHTFQYANPASEKDITAYMDHCRLWRDHIRQSHDSERKAWDIERSALKAHIAELEQKLNRTRRPQRRSSNDAPKASLNSFKSHTLPVAVNGKKRLSESFEPTPSERPVWIGSETSAPATRVFSHDEDVFHHLPSISEDAMPALSREVSPTSGGPANLPIPIQQVDRTLDGINVRPAGLTSSFDKGLTSPQFASPAQSPSSRPRQEAPFSSDFSNLLAPMDERLKRYAGHTPMAVHDSTMSSNSTSAVLTPKQEQPFAPVPTARPSVRPSERAESYFSTTDGDDDKENHKEESQPGHEPQDDPALKGPLTLGASANGAGSVNFLDSLDARLTEEKALQDRTESRLSGHNGEQKSNSHQEDASAFEDDPPPRLRMKSSMNFGRPLGQKYP